MIGYKVTSKADQDTDNISTSVIDNKIEIVGANSKVLLLACIDSIHVNSDVKTVDRFSKGLWGGGISNFSYVDPKLLKGISTFCQLCRLDFHLCVLKNIIEVPRLEDLYNILICVFLGWLNSLRVLIGQLKLGIKVFACTF